MPATLALWLISKGVPKRLIYPLMIAALALAIIAAVALAIHIHDRRIVREHDADITQAVTSASTAADAAANAGDTIRASEAAERAAVNEKVITDAVQAHPVEVLAPVGAATAALAASLRAREATSRTAARKPR